MPRALHRIEDFTIEGTTGSINGTGVFELHLEWDYSGDVGGWDGWAVSGATFLRLEIDGISVCNRKAAEHIMTPSGLLSAEVAVADAEQDNASDWIGVAA